MRQNIKQITKLYFSNTKRFFSVALILLLTFHLAGAQSQTEIVEQYNKAIGAPTNEKITLLTQVLSKAPNFLEARYALGATYYELENFKAAVPHFEYILARPQDVAQKPALASIVQKTNLKDLVAAAYNAIGNNFIEMAKTDSAITVLQRAIQLDRGKAIFHYNLGIAYLKKARYSLALESLRESLKINSNNALAWFNLGTSYWYLNEYKSAIDAYQKGLEIEPNNQSAIANLKKAEDKIRVEMLFSSADSALAANNPGFAISLFNRIKAIDPSHPALSEKLQKAQMASKYNNAVEDFRAGRLHASLELLNELPQGYKNSSKLKNDIRQKIQDVNTEAAAQQRYRSAVSLFQKGSYIAARAAVDELIKQDPRFPGLQTLSTRIDSAIQANQKVLSAAQKTQTLKNENTIAQPEITAPPEDSLQAALTSISASDSHQVDRESSNIPSLKEENVANIGNGFDLQMLLVILATGSILVFSILFLAKQKRLREKRISEQKMPGQTDAGDDSQASVFVKAAVEKVDFTELEKNKTSASDSSNQKFFEGLIDDKVISNDPLSDSSSVEIREIPDHSAQEEADDSKQENIMKETLAEEDDPDQDDFLAIVQDDSIAPRETDDDNTGNLDGVDATHTVDMSQFKTRKIGRYIIEKEIGRGAAGRIYKAWDPKLDRTVVIKTVSYSLTSSDDEIKRLKARVYREARAAAKLNHPNIVVVYDVEDEPTFSYIVMEHIEGPDLRELLQKENKISASRTLNILKQVCKALQFSHAAGIIHRDIKPSNILIIKKDKVKVTDFGIAKVSNHMTLTQTGRVVGTPSYMAPEQIEGSDVDGRADIFSMGVVFYELLTGQRPFVGESLAALAYKIVHVEPTPPSLINLELTDICDEMVSRAIAKDPSDRYQSINDFLKDLQRAQSQLTASK
ncbi:MAG: protein kinase [bacterium]